MLIISHQLTIIFGPSYKPLTAALNFFPLIPVINGDSKLKMWNTSFNHLMKDWVGKCGNFNMNFRTQLTFLGIWEIGGWWLTIKIGGSIFVYVKRT